MKDKKEEKNLGSEVSRRDFIKGAATGALAVAATGVLSACATPGAAGRAAREPSPIFEPTRIGSLTLKNKLIRGPMAERRHDANGNPTSAMLNMIEEEAAGGIGMITLGAASVIREESIAPDTAGFFDASQIPAWRRAVDVAHKNGAKICLQIFVPGDGPNSPFGVNAISTEDIRRCVNAFAQTTVWLRDAGFDAVNLHYAHAYLGGQFWSHFVNRRTDEYGGSAENRARFAFEILEATRRAVGRDYPLIARINASEHRRHLGSSQAETNFYVQGLADRGIDAVETSVSGGSAWMNILSKEDFNYNSRDARNIAAGTNVPLILVGGTRSIFMMEEALRHNDKLVAFCMARTILAEPDLPNKWQKDPKYTPKCISCNWCMATLFSGPRMLCVLDQNRV